MSKAYSTPELNRLLHSKLKQSEYWTAKTRENGNTIQGLTCPECGKSNEAWAYAANDQGNGPFSINCNRKSECGCKTNTIELFNIRLDIEKEHKPTKTDPHRTARVYLQSRGINIALKGLDYEYWPTVRGLLSGAVMLPLGKDNEGKQVYNGRVFNPPNGEGKTHNSGSTSGQYWHHPSVEYTPKKPLYVTEGILDSLSLIEIGQQAIAILAAGQVPSKVDLTRFRSYPLVFAFDNDKAGHKATKNWCEHYPEAKAILPNKGQDWNDLLQNSNGNNAEAFFRANQQRYEVNSLLALAGSAREYVTIYRDFYNKVPGLFLFDDCLYHSSLKKRGEDTNIVVDRCGRFTLQVLSFFKDTSNPEHPEYRYHLHITRKGSRPVQATATGRDLATPRGIKEFFLTRAKVSFEAGAIAATALATMITSSRHAPEVNQLALTGFDLKTKWWVYKYFAIDNQGKLHHPDKKGLYKVNHREWITPPAHAADKAIKPAKNGTRVSKIHKLMTEAWGHNGAAAMAWMVAGWRVNDIKEQIGFFPFMSLHGDPASGKSALTVMLNAMQGHNGEGLPLSQLNSKKGLARSISRVSGMFTALLEDNQRNERAFDYSILLTGYNHGPLQIQAAFSNDNRTKEAPFQGTLMMVQNTEPFNQKAEKQRVISLHFDHTDLTENTRAAYEQLVKIPLPQLTRVLVLTLQKHQLFESSWQETYNQAIDDLAGVENRRILQNHALVLAFHRLFCQAHKIDYDLTDFILKTAHEKCRTSDIKAYSPADKFFEAIDILDDEKSAHHLHFDAEKRLVYLNLTGLEGLIRNKGVFVDSQLTQSLMDHPAFIENGKRHRFPENPEMDKRGLPKQRRAWVFDAEKFD
ncbi:MAG: toprim domain-containing protein [Desulfocapsa sp.]|nr:toprim domain-containing protein [Desulfocapsa sp.]